MTDDIWRNQRGAPDDGGPGGRRPGRFEAQMDDFDDDEFGGPLFGDDSGGTSTAADATGGHERVSGEHPGLDLSDDTTGPLPHWTEPPTGEVPKIEAARSDADERDDLDVWSTFTSESPVWQEGDHVDAPTGAPRSSGVPVFDDGVEAPADPTGELRWEDDPSGGSALDERERPEDRPAPAPVASPGGADPAAVTTTHDALTADVPREPARITIGTDPSGMPRRPDPRRGAPQRPPSSGVDATSSDGRNLPVAIGTGAGLAVVFLALTILVGPLGSLLFVVAVLAVCGIEYFGKVTEKGYRPAVAPGVIAIVMGVLAAYWVAPQGIVITVTFAFLVGVIGFTAAPSIEVGPMPNTAITTLGIVWIGVLGAYAGLILDFSNGGGPDGRPWGTDTLVLLAIGVVANDVGAYFVGSAFGRTPLRSWISPSKSVEGLLGGTVLTIIVMVIIGLQELSDTWSNMGHLLALGVVISVLTPLGDLTESMFKRNLGVKDFGTVIAGHGGALDRFDGFLVALPGVYYLLVVLEPWTARV